MRLSFLAFCHLVSTATILLSPVGVTAFVPHRTLERFRRIEEADARNPQTTLKYVDTDRLELENLIEIEAISLPENEFKVQRKVAPIVSRMASYLVPRLSSILKRSEDSELLFSLEKLEDETNDIPVALPETRGFDINMASSGDSKPKAALSTRNIERSKTGPWSMPVMDRVKTEKVQPWGVKVNNPVVRDVRNVASRPTGMSTIEPSPLPYFAIQIATPDFRCKKSETLPRSTGAPYVETIEPVDVDEPLAIREAIVLTSSPSWSKATERAMQAFGDALGIVQNIWSTAATAVFESASSMAREYAANLQKGKQFPSPPNIPPTDTLFDVEMVMRQVDSALQTEEGSIEARKAVIYTGNNIDFFEIDKVLKQAESALEYVETKKPTISVRTTNMDFSEIDDVLMEAESALKLAEEFIH